MAFSQPRRRTLIGVAVAVTTAAAGLVLSDEQVARLDGASAVALGFPHEMLAIPAYRDRIAGGKLGLLDGPARPVR